MVKLAATFRMSILAILLPTLVSGAMAQERTLLTYRFTPGVILQDFTKFTGEFKISGPGGAQMKLEAATVLARRINSVTASGEADISMRFISASIRLIDGDKQVFSIQDRQGVVTLLNEQVVSSSQTPIPDITLRMARNGQIVTTSAPAQNQTHRLMQGLQYLLLPAEEIAVGARWSYQTLASIPLDGLGVTASAIEMAVTYDVELQSVDVQDGRRIATIVSSTRSQSQALSGAPRAITTFRFDVDAGQFTGADGEFSIEMPLGGGQTVSSGAPAISGVLKFHSTSGPLDPAGTIASIPAMKDEPKQPPGIPPNQNTAALPMLYSDMDTSGNQPIATFDLPDADPRLCQAACMKEARCQAFTYTSPGKYNYPNPRCWLKDSPGTLTPNAGVISGFRQ